MCLNTQVVSSFTLNAGVTPLSGSDIDHMELSFSGQRLFRKIK